MSDEYLELEKACFQAVEHNLQTIHTEEEARIQKEKSSEDTFFEPKPTKNSTILGSIYSYF